MNYKLYTRLPTDYMNELHTTYMVTNRLCKCNVDLYTNKRVFGKPIICIHSESCDIQIMKNVITKN